MVLRPLRIIAIALVITIVVVAIGLQVGARALQGQVIAALGPRAEVGSTSVGWSGVVLTGVRVKADRQHWPTDDELRAERIVVTPDLRGLLGGAVRISTIVVEGGYLSVFRTASGKVRLLPALLDRKTADNAPQALPAVVIGRVELRSAAVDFFDASVRQPAVLQRLERIEASLADVKLPSLTGRSTLRMEGTHRGVARNGTISLAGGVEFSSLDSKLALRLRGIDLLAFQPYLVKAIDTGVRRGAIDLDLDATVRRHQLAAPGTLVIAGLELAPSDGHGSLAGLTRQALVAYMKDHKENITVHFALDGNLDDPKYSLNENFATKVASALGKVVGVSVEGVVRGVGDVAGSAAHGLGAAVKKLFGR